MLGPQVLQQVGILQIAVCIGEANPEALSEAEFADLLDVNFLKKHQVGSFIITTFFMGFKSWA